MDEDSKILLARVATALECIAFTLHSSALVEISLKTELTDEQKTKTTDKLSEGFDQLTRGRGYSSRTG